MHFAWLELISIFIIVFFAQIGGCIVGGGGFIVQPALIAFGIPPHMAVANDISTSATGNLSAAFNYARRNNLRWDLVHSMALGLFFGAFLGVALLRFATPFLLEKFLGVLAIFFLLQVFFFKRSEQQAAASASQQSAMKISLGSSMIGLFLGAYTTFSGAGTGSIAVLLISRFFDLAFVESIGVRWVCLGSVGLIGFVHYYFLGLIHWPILLTLLAANILAGFYASKIVLTLGERWIRPIFFCSILGFSIYLILR